MRLAHFSLVIVLACGGRASPPMGDIAPGGSDSVHRTPEAAVYAALIDSVYIRPVPDTLLLGDSTLSFRIPEGGRPEWRAQYDSLPVGLPAALQALSRAKRASRELPLPRPIHVITHATLREIFSGGIRGWEEFYRRYPRQRNYLQFSPVAFSSDARNALVYYEYHCGELCGGGNAVWLTRGDGQRWKVRKRIMFWIS